MTHKKAASEAPHAAHSQKRTVHGGRPARQVKLRGPDSIRTVSPPWRSGAVIGFKARRLAAFTGTIALKMGADVAPAESFDVIFSAGGKPMSFVTGRGEEFYVEDLQPGRYPARLVGFGHNCAFELVVPPTKTAFTELPPIVCDTMR